MKRLLSWVKVEGRDCEWQSKCGNYRVWRNAMGVAPRFGGDGPEWAAATLPVSTDDRDWICRYGVSRADAAESCEDHARLATSLLTEGI